MNKKEEMDCSDIMKYMNDYIDGNLEPEIAVFVKNHLESCLNCRIIYHTLSKTINLCQECTKNIHLPEEVHGRLIARLGLDDEANSPN